MKTALKVLFSMLMAWMITGCASIMSGGTAPVSLRSTPAGASYVVTDAKGTVLQQGVAPAIISLKTSTGYFDEASYQVRFSLPGHEDQVVPLRASLNGWYWGNILAGGLIGMLIVDPLTGAMYKLPATVTADLPEADVNIARGSGDLMIVSLNNLPESVRSQLIRVE